MIVIATSAEIELMKDMRTKEYLKTIEWMKNNLLDYKVIFIETVKGKDSFIEKYYPVFYSNTHDPKYTNQGTNHGLSLKKFFEVNKFESEDLIIQTTGRYHFIDSYFFDTIENNSGCDFYGLEMDGPGIGENQYFTGCFAMKYKYIEDWVNTTDWVYLNLNQINFEKSLHDYVKKNNIKTFNIDKVNMDCNIFAKGNLNRIKL